MQSESIGNDFKIDANFESIKNHFIGWQCRVREYSLRHFGGRPSLGMCPRVLNSNKIELSPSIILLLLPKSPEESIQQFSYIAKKTNDPNERFKKAIQLLSSTFYQDTDFFSGNMTGLFLKNSPTFLKILESKHCFLEFNYQNQFFKISCSVNELKKDDFEYKFTYWHNFLFNPNLPPESMIIVFKPNWSHSISEPSLNWK